VNLTARIESMCRELSRQLLLSSAFVREGRLAAKSLGRFSLKGVGADQEIFAPVNPDAPG
jgi:adenylate cyclase